MFLTHEKYGGEGKYTWVCTRGGFVLYGSVASTVSGFGSSESCGAWSYLEPFLQVQPVPDTEEVAGDERALARPLFVAVRLVEFEGGDVAAGDV